VAAVPIAWAWLSPAADVWFHQDMDLDQLRGRIRGRVMPAGAAEYETVRRAMLWNERCPERRPSAIVRIAEPPDVAAAIEFARANALQIAIRSGGHSWCGAPLRDGAVLLDLGGLGEAIVDPSARTASVQPAVTGRGLASRLAAHGLAFPVGHCSTVALGGYLLSGGLGWNGASWGPACLSVREIEVITADGVLRRASADVHPDLLWAARGAGPGFFGVVTRFHLAARPMPQAMTTRTDLYPLGALPRIAEWLPDLAAALPRSVELTVLITGIPPGTPAPAGERLCVALMATAFADDPAAAGAALAPLDRGPLTSLRCGGHRDHPATFDALFEIMDGHFPARHRCQADMIWSAAAPRDVLGELPALLARAPSPRSRLLCTMPPRVSTPPDCAFGMSAGLLVACYAFWDDPAQDQANCAWHREVMAVLDAHAVGYYIGESDIAGRPARARGAFIPSHWLRLEALRRQWDPDRRFCGYFG
jgi:FAD/FMN-containing dehydrogenase